METNRYHDLMKEALARRQSAGLSPDFTARTLLRLQREKARKEHRTEIWGLITISVISLALVASVGIILYFYDILPSKENVNDILLTIKRNFKLYLVESLPYYGLALLARHTFICRLLVEKTLVQFPTKSVRHIILSHTYSLYTSPDNYRSLWSSYKLKRGNI